ncbi:lck-interacting transmembrane adapter 1 isoform X2 [Choloepus didactylus]|nr:lck-interacting transmembrane adapter 1 isoform X2 [Choloepus didactylus]XP_037667203.1 lck-interacting transmembrane adapter 1 isoform X2 [Choloepus didactylus]XP_037667204.1 lck-interacting transmembrane adapter 1 isoform X2 [Choloepus didactylus]XP_037667205.1 lck-interacting transmembrane adapter 1 isoform X2 [Choloepus didactylus]
MSPQVPSAPPALWVVGCFALLLWLWALCTACHRKQARRQQTELQGSGRPTGASPLRRPHLCTLSKSDTRLHELHQGPRESRAPRPASMDLLHPHWPERLSAAPSTFARQEQPRPWPASAVPPIGPEATYSNVGLVALPRASLAASPVVWAGARLVSNCARPGTGLAVPEYACIRKPKGTDGSPQSLHQGKTERMPASQVDALYSRVSKPQRRGPGAATAPQDSRGDGAVLALGSDRASAALPVRGLGVDSGPLENVYESIQEMRAPTHPEPPSSGY